jgi:hypothetical protein
VQCALFANSPIEIIFVLPSFLNLK